MRRNTLIFFAVLVVLLLSLLVVFPLDKGVLGGKGIRLGLDLQGGTNIVFQADLSKVKPGEERSAIDGAVAVLENRVNPLGVTEPVIQRQGNDRILVQLPGVTITDREKEGLARVAVLEFGELVAANSTDNSSIKWKNELGSWKPATGVVDNQTLELTSQYFLNNTYVDQSQFGSIRLVFHWDSIGSQLSEQITNRLMNQQLGIFEGDQALRGEGNTPIAPVVHGVITDTGEITGLSLKEATTLSKQLNAGRLPVPLTRVYDQTVSPTLGSNFVNLSVKAGLIGILATMLFMIIYYRVSGVVASLALVYYGILLFAIFKLLNVTMSLSAIGGFVLSLGMAVDANVLIFERMKEEIWAGRTIGAAMDTGFSRAWPAIWDSNITTILAGVILLWLSSTIVASGPVRGFSLTLIIGVVSSMFTAITVTRTFLRPLISTGLGQYTSLFTPIGSQRRKVTNV